jgi:hypothetical protein
MKASFALCLVLSVPAAAQAVLPEAPAPHINRINAALDGGEILMRELDAVSTRMVLSNPCSCFHESGNLGFMQPAASYDWSQYAYSTGMAAGYIYSSHLLWKAGSKRHSRILLLASRVLLASDITMETRADVHNFHLATITTRPGFKKVGK